MTHATLLATIVLIHGLGGDPHVWDGVVAKLPKTERVVTVSLPRGDSLDGIARAVAAELRAKQATPAIVVGHSLGGAVAAHLALVDPTALRALVLVDMTIRPVWPANEVAELRDGLAKDREAMLRRWFGGICKPTQLERLLTGLRALPDQAILGYVHAMSTGGITDGGRRLTMPTLLMASKLLDPKEAGVEHVPSLRVERFSESMHWVMWDEPDHFVATLTKFIASLPAERR